MTSQVFASFRSHGPWFNTATSTRWMPPVGVSKDIGLALVIEGKFASTAEVVDLGSGSVKVLDLSTELVVLDWVYDPTIEHVAELITASAATRQSEELQSYSRQLGLRGPRADRGSDHSRARRFFGSDFATSVATWICTRAHPSGLCSVRAA